MSGFQEVKLEPPTDPALRRVWDEGRLSALREVRAAAYKLDKNPLNDPYLWGYGASQICKLLSDAVRAARIQLDESEGKS